MSVFHHLKTPCWRLKEQFTQKRKFNYLVTFMLMEIKVKFLGSQNISGASQQSSIAGSILPNYWTGWTFVLKCKKPKPEWKTFLHPFKVEIVTVATKLQVLACTLLMGARPWTLLSAEESRKRSHSNCLFKCSWHQEKLQHVANGQLTVNQTEAFAATSLWGSLHTMRKSLLTNHDMRKGAEH